MFSMNKFGNDLYTGKVSVPFVRRRRLWFFIAVALVLGAVAVLLIKPPQFSIDFTGGSQFTVSGVEAPDQLVAGDTVREIVPNATTKVTTVGDDAVRVQTDQMSETETREVAAALADAYKVDPAEVTT